MKTDLISLQQREDFKSLINVLIERSYIRKVEFLRLWARRHELNDHLIKVFSHFTARVPDTSPAGVILGEDYFSPSEVSLAQDLTYTEGQIDELLRSLPDDEKLKWCRKHNFMLLPGPPNPMALYDIHKLKRRYFSPENAWIEMSREGFVHNVKTSCRWLMIRKESVPGSEPQTWTGQDLLLSACEEVPNIAELVWSLITYTAVTNFLLLYGVFVRTSSFGANSSRVCVSNQKNGLRVECFDGHVLADHVGLSSAR